MSICSIISIFSITRRPKGPTAAWLWRWSLAPPARPRTPSGHRGTHVKPTSREAPSTTMPPIQTTCRKRRGKGMYIYCRNYIYFLKNKPMGKGTLPKHTAKNQYKGGIYRRSSWIASGPCLHRCRMHHLSLTPVSDNMYRTHV